MQSLFDKKMNYVIFFLGKMDLHHMEIRPGQTKKPFEIEQFVGTRFDDGFLFAVKKSSSNLILYLICSPTRSGVLYSFENASNYTWTSEFKWNSGDTVSAILDDDGVVHVSCRDKRTINHITKALRIAKIDLVIRDKVD
jgi:hypothetical protein